MKFAELPLQKKKKIYTAAVVFFFSAYFAISVLTPRAAWYRDFKYGAMIALIVFGKKLRKLQNIENGLPEDYQSPEKIRFRNIVFIIIGIAIVVGSVISFLSSK